MTVSARFGSAVAVACPSDHLPLQELLLLLIACPVGQPQLLLLLLSTAACLATWPSQQGPPVTLCAAVHTAVALLDGSPP